MTSGIVNYWCQTALILSILTKALFAHDAISITSTTRLQVHYSNLFTDQWRRTYGVMRLMFRIPYDQWRQRRHEYTWLPLGFPPEDIGLVCSIHYTHRKLIVHILIETTGSTLMRRKLNVALTCRASTAIDRAAFVATDLEKYTSYEDAIKKQYIAKWKL